MSGKSPNYYDVLGVSRNATKKEITAQYTRLIKENHPDKFEGLKNKYEANNDKELLKVLEKAIAEAEEKAKEVNEAYSILSNTNKRRVYDNSLINIVITPTKLSLGSIKQGEKATASFIIESRGAKIGRVSIDWQNKKTWGDLVIEPDPDNDFPIKVTIKVSTIGLAPGIFNGQVNIEIDGEQYNVPIDFKVIPVPVISHTKVKSGISTFRWFRGKSKGFRRMLTMLIISAVAIGSLVIATVSVSKKNSHEKQFAIAQETKAIETMKAYDLQPTVTLHQPTTTPTHVPTPTEPFKLTLEEIERRYKVQNNQGSRIDLEGEISLFSTNPEELVKVERLNRGPFAKDSSLYADYVIVNLSKYSEISIYQDECEITAPDEYDSLPLVLHGNEAPPLYPGGSRFLRCREYELTAVWAWGWLRQMASVRGDDACIGINFRNQVGEDRTEMCFDLPVLPIDLSSLVKISAKRLPTMKTEYSGILEIEFEISDIPYSLFVKDVTGSGCQGYYKWLKQDPKDSRLFVDSTREDWVFKRGDIKKIYLYLSVINSCVPNKFCFELSTAYVPSKIVCVNTP